MSLYPNRDSANTSSERITPEQALALLKEASTAELMSRSHAARSRIQGRNVYHVHSLNLNPTNVCENRCGLCAFWREADSSDAYILTLEEATERMAAAKSWRLTDIHVVGGLTREFRLDYYLQLFRRAREILPGVAIQGLTAVEVSWIAELEGMSVTGVLKTLKEAGLSAIPGGGAEIFSSRVRQIICPNKISADQWLEVHRSAHGLGVPTNATMLFGHIETSEDIVDHLSRLRDMQDETGGFLAFCPLPFHASGTQIGVERGPAGHMITRIVALARIFLDNFPHIRVLANFLDRKLLQTLLHSGADDIGGTSIDEQIARAAGAPDESSFATPEEMAAFIEDLGMTPILTNSTYSIPDSIRIDPACPTIPSLAQKALSEARLGKRLSAEQAVVLHDCVPFQELGRLAHERRRQVVGDNYSTFIIDRNISFTNVCTVACKFCAFHKSPNHVDSFLMPIEEIVRRVQEAAELGATQIMLQGGLNPALNLEWYERMLATIKESVGDIWLHSLSPAEVFWLAGRSALTVKECLERLRIAGLDSLPGGGAEILVDEIRDRVSPAKITRAQWFEVMETAQQLGMGTTATMVYGLGETTEQRVQHLIQIRDLQDRTGGFRAFIPWSFQSNNTKLPYKQLTGIDYLQMVALSRLVLDNVEHIQAGWVTEGPHMAQMALEFGADDFGGVLMEESVVKATGIDFGMTVDNIIALIKEAGMVPAQRNTEYRIIRTFEENRVSAEEIAAI